MVMLSYLTSHTHIRECVVGLGLVVGGGGGGVQSPTALLLPRWSRPLNLAPRGNGGSVRSRVGNREDVKRNYLNFDFVLFLGGTDAAPRYLKFFIIPDPRNRGSREVASWPQLHIG